MNPYLDGSALYGDDLDASGIAAWYRDEAEAYYELGGRSQIPATYGYRELNRQSLFRYVGQRQFRHAVGLGAGTGTEVEPLAAQIQRLTIIESSLSYTPSVGLRMPVALVEAQPSGDLALPAKSADLLTCLGVLHHIPNVSHVIGEIGRILEPGGLALIREPITSMGGDWGHERPLLTPHERGIPLPLLRRWLTASGLKVQQETALLFPPIGRLWRITGHPPYNSAALTALDRAICRITAANWRYHATNRWEKIRPTNVAMVAIKATD